jgi:hypothetical protein
MRNWARWLAIGLVCVLSAATRSHAYFLDPATRNFDVRLRTYTQTVVMTEGSGPDWPSEGQYHLGTWAGQRNFYNPEFDARLTDYMKWMGPVAADDFKFRFAWWGFFDPLYDLPDSVFNKNRKDLRARLSQSNNVDKESYTFQDEGKNARHIYGRRNRINELYVDYNKGRLFLRAGRQTLSWGESDDIVFLDVTQQFDLTQGEPGFYQDLDEARIPFWALRGTYKLVDNWKWLSSFFGEAYIVPGIIDTTVPTDPMVGGVSPYSPDQEDPQKSIDAQAKALGIPGIAAGLHTVIVSQQPANSWANTRWGIRFQGVVDRDYTVQSYFYRTFNGAPAPLLTTQNPNTNPTLIDDRGFRLSQGDCIDPATGNALAKPPKLPNNIGAKFGHTASGRNCSWAIPVVTILERRLESVAGIASSWYSPTVRGVIRAETEFFKDELAAIPSMNLNPLAQNSTLNPPHFNHVPKADYLRGVLGYDTFFFFRPVNPSNSITYSTAVHFAWNTSDRAGHHFRNAQGKPGKPQSGPTGGPVPDSNFEDLYTWDSLYWTQAVQTDFLHGKLTPRIVAILYTSGMYAFAPDITYRVSDNLLFDLRYFGITAERRSNIATFREHDQLQLRLTFQLN